MTEENGYILVRLSESVIAMTDVLEKPTVEAVKAAGKTFDEKYRVFEDALKGLLEHYPNNIKTEDVLLKVITLNDLYSTHIPLYGNRIPTVWDVVDHIVKRRIDSDLDSGSTDLVYDIAKTEIQNKVHFNYSFATKYCSWHRQDLFPIYDSRVDEYLWYSQDHGWIDPFKREELKIYKRLKETITEFQDKCGLGEFNFKQIDKFLYFEGGKLLEAIEKKKHAAIMTESSQSLSESNEDEKTKP